MQKIGFWGICFGIFSSDFAHEYAKAYTNLCIISNPVGRPSFAAT